MRITVYGKRRASLLSTAPSAWLVYSGIKVGYQPTFHFCNPVLQTQFLFFQAPNAKLIDMRNKGKFGYGNIEIPMRQSQLFELGAVGKGVDNYIVHLYRGANPRIANSNGVAAAP